MSDVRGQQPSRLFWEKREKGNGNPVAAVGNSRFAHITSIPQRGRNRPSFFFFFPPLSHYRQQTAATPPPVTGDDTWRLPTDRIRKGKVRNGFSLVSDRAQTSTPDLVG